MTDAAPDDVGRLPYFPWYADDFVGSETMTLDHAHVGCYALLLSFAWSLRGIPNDPEVIGRCLRLPKAQAMRVFRSIQATRFVLRDGRWINERQERDRVKLEARVRTARDNGSRGGTARALALAQAGGQAAAIAPGIPPATPPAIAPGQAVGVAARARASKSTAAQQRGREDDTLDDVTHLLDKINPQSLRDLTSRFVSLVSDRASQRAGWIMEIDASMTRDGAAPEHVERALSDLLLLGPDEIPRTKPIYFRACVRSAKAEANGGSNAAHSDRRFPSPARGPDAHKAMQLEGRRALNYIRDKLIVTNDVPGRAPSRSISKKAVEKLGGATLMAYDSVGGASVVLAAEGEKLSILLAQFANTYASAVEKGLARFEEMLP